MTRYIKSGTVNRIQEVNSELEKIAASQVDLLARDGETPNAMNDTLDMNSNKIINVITDPLDDTSLVNRGFVYSQEEVDSKDTSTLTSAREYAQSILGQDVAYGTNVAFMESFGVTIGEDASTAFQAYLDSSIPMLDLQGINWAASSISVDNTAVRTALQNKFVTNGTIQLTNSLLGDSLVRDKANIRRDATTLTQTKSPIVDWNGLRVLWLGTSIPHQGAGVDSYPERLSTELGFTVVNKAWSGSTASYNKDGDPFNVDTIKSLSMTEADRLAGLATYGTGSAYDDSFNNINKASELTADARIKAIFEEAPLDSVVLDHNHNDRKLIVEYTANNKVISSVAIGTETVFTTTDTTGLEVGDGCYVRVTGINNLDYAAGRIQAVTGTTVTVAINSTGFAGTFSSGTLLYTDRDTLNGCFDFLIAYTKNMGIINGREAVKIILCNAPSYYTNNVNEDHSIWSVGYNISKLAEKWNLTYYDVANDLEVVFRDHLIYLPDGVHPSTPETRKIFTDFWGKWMIGGGTLLDRNNFLATNRNITSVHDNLALFSKYDQTYSYRNSLFTKDTAVIDDDFTAGIGSWTTVGNAPTTTTAPWDAGETAVRFNALASNAASYLSQTVSGGSTPVFSFDFYLSDVDIATGVSNQVAIASIVGASGAAYTVSLIQTAGSGLFLRGTYNREGFGQAPLAVLPAVLFPVSVNTKYRITLDIIDGYVNFTINNTLIYAGRIFNELLGALTAYQIGVIFSNMGTAFPLFMGNVEVFPKVTTSNRSYNTLLKTAQEFETFAEMQLASVPEGRRAICRGRADAEYIVQPSGYVALTGDVTFANGLIGKLQVDVGTQITTVGLINSVATYPVETVINTLGFTALGDGGKGEWKQNGVTGQTINQSPLQLVNAGLLNDGLGNQWGWVSEESEISPEDIGYQEGQDIALYLPAIFAYFVAETRGVLNLGASVYTFLTQFTNVGGSLNVTINCKRDATRILHNSSAAGFLFTGQVNNFHLRGYPEIINNGQKTTASTQAFFVFQSGNTNSSFQADYRPSQLATDADLLAGFYYCTPGQVNDTIDFYLNCAGIAGDGITLGAGSTVYLWGGRLIGAWKPFPAYPSNGLNVTGGMGGLYVMGTDIIQNKINARIAKDTGVSNREIFFNPSILDSSFRSLEITDESYVSASGIWTASANDACIYYAPALDTDSAALVIAGGTIFNAGVNDPSALDGDAVGIKLGANGRIVASGLYFRNNAGRAISRIAVGGSRFSTFDACSFSTNATRAGTAEQVFINGNMKLTNITAAASDTNIVNRGGTLGFKMAAVDTKTDVLDGVALTGSGVAFVNNTGHDLMVYIRNGTGTTVSVDGTALLTQASGAFEGFSLKVPIYSSLSVVYSVAPNVIIQRL